MESGVASVVPVDEGSARLGRGVSLKCGASHGSLANRALDQSTMNSDGPLSEPGTNHPQRARGALAQDNLYPRIAALSLRVLRSEKV
jgi:hypothetical protein